MANDNRAVVLAKEADVRAGPDTGDTILFRVHEGTIVHYDRAEDDWILLQLSEGKRGWVGSLQRFNIDQVDQRELPLMRIASRSFHYPQKSR
jgi:hypothetical protein